MKKVSLSTYDLAQRFVGIKEVPGNKDNPFIVWALSLCSLPDVHDEVAWCSAFVNVICFILGLPRSKSAAARSWLLMGTAVELKDAELGDIVVLKRGTGDQPGPEVINAPGHVGFYAGLQGGRVLVVAGNQGDAVSNELFKVENILGIRRL